MRGRPARRPGRGPSGTRRRPTRPPWSPSWAPASRTTAETGHELFGQARVGVSVDATDDLFVPGSADLATGVAGVNQTIEPSAAVAVEAFVGYDQQAAAGVQGRPVPDWRP